MQVELL